MRGYAFTQEGRKRTVADHRSFCLDLPARVLSCHDLVEVGDVACRHQLPTLHLSRLAERWLVGLLARTHETQHELVD